MDLKELSQAMQDFVNAKGWYQPDSHRPQTPRNIAISLCLEAAEVLEHFQWTEDVLDKPELAGELADVTLYLLQLARLTNIDLEKAVLAKLDQNYQRTWDQSGE
jgi:NTP pyrophosphatase (non-canonical NTP hydrolase)